MSKTALGIVGGAVLGGAIAIGVKSILETPTATHTNLAKSITIKRIWQGTTVVTTPVCVKYDRTRDHSVWFYTYGDEIDAVVGIGFQTSNSKWAAAVTRMAWAGLDITFAGKHFVMPTVTQSETVSLGYFTALLT